MKFLFHLTYENFIQSKIKIILKLTLFLEWIQCWNRVKVKPFFSWQLNLSIVFLIWCDISSQDPPGTVHGSPLKYKHPNITLLLFLCGSNNSLSHKLLGRKTRRVRNFLYHVHFLNKVNHEESFPLTSNYTMLQWQWHCCCFLQKGIWNKVQEKGQFFRHSRWLHWLLPVTPSADDVSD